MTTDIVRRLICLAEPPIGWLLLDNPRRANAISLSMWHELIAGLKRLAEQPDIRVVIIAGADDRNFCSGGDITEFATLRANSSDKGRFDDVSKQALDALNSIDKPTIAAIAGYCLGAGMAISASCDIRIAADTARFSIPAVKRGISYDFERLRQLVGLVGPGAAKLIMYTGRQFSAAEALRLGFVTEAVPPEQLKDHAIALAKEIAGNAPLSVAASKSMIDMALRDEYDASVCLGWEKRCMDSADYAEATRAFMEKRAPVFTGR